MTLLHRPAGAALAAYHRDAVLSATPAQLVTMLYDRLLLDLERAELAQREARWPDASAQLLHAQDIVTELSASLRPGIWDGSDRLLALYAFVSSELVAAHVERSAERTATCAALLEPLRSAWHEAAAVCAAGAEGAAHAG